MNSIPKKAIIKKNNFSPNNSNPYQTLLQNQFFHIALICASLIFNLIIIYLFKNNYNKIVDPYTQLSLFHLTAIFSGMFLGGITLGLKKGAFGISLGVFLGATLGMWLSLLTEGKIISWMI